MHPPCTPCAACLQEHTSDKHCVGWFWNFANASARDYFVSHLVAPLAEAPFIDGVFFDAVNYGYDIPEVIVSIAIVSIARQRGQLRWIQDGWVD